MKTVLATGGAGFIGSHICDKLVKTHRVICVDNFVTSSKNNIQQLLNNPNFKLIEHDVIEPLSINESIDYIFHLASPASPNHHSDISYHSLPMKTMLVNTQGTLNMLNLAKKKNARLLFASTSEVYGDPEVHPQVETYNGNVSTTGPRSVYDEAKRFGETLVAHFHRKEGVDGRIVRIFNTYGPRMMKQDKRMIINFILQGLDGEDITVYGDGSQTRSLCYVSDLVDGLATYMFKDELDGEIINMGSEQEHTVDEYAELVKKLVKSKSNITHTEELPKNDPLKRRPDISKAKKLLNWKPSTPLEQGLSKTIEYFKTL